MLVLAMACGLMLGPNFSSAQSASNLGPASLESFYVGTLHLGFAAARASCSPAEQPLPAAILNLIATDLQTARTGTMAMAAYIPFDFNRFTNVANQVPSLNGGGKVDGTMQGNTLVGKWSDANGRGNTRYEFTPDRSSFEHFWQWEGSTTWSNAGICTRK
jgi:hypothetical protein